ncbi:MAG: DUF4173 domain-containing protein [Bacteroidales bacterium]|nr:DUF4173 domain-containing protein [Bacteroidales bacterium]MCM1415153.1 DUF4173 domain-containing protein [bacterium]MCM1423387.1 DUF4173 domain-containing protein [bacterium]
MEQITYLDALERAQKTEEKPDTVYTQRMREKFPLFGIGSLIYAAFYALCLYKNASGITYPFFVIGTLCYFFFCMKKLGVPCKKGSAFPIVSVVLLGLSNCLTASPQLLLLNKCGIFLLTFTLILHTVYNDSSWDLPQYFAAIFRTIGTSFCCLFRPFGDMVCYFDAKKQEKIEKKGYILPIFIGLLIAAPLLFVMMALLASADKVFDRLLVSAANLFRLSSFSAMIELGALLVIVFFCSYAAIAAFCKKSAERETTGKRMLFDPVIAIVVTGLLSIPYLLFVVIQIAYLFLGSLTLPAGYTYAQYAREGFFQLLAVCVINLGIVLICLRLFRESKLLKGILLVLSGCTFIMIFSSALRMILYIDTYALTFLRIFVLWSLAVIFLLMAGVTAFILYGRFPLFRYGVVVVTVCYLALSFSHPDFFIARYNISRDCDRDYLSRLSADAAPVILDPSSNPYLTSVEDMLEKTADYTEDYENFYNNYWMKIYYDKTAYRTEGIGLRNFNFSLYRAGKLLSTAQ